MNPFDLDGPGFLVFYGATALALLVAVVVLRRSFERCEEARAPLDDPYLVAFLRGGKLAAVRVAVLSLLERGWLVRKSGRPVRLVRRTQLDPPPARRPLERRLLDLFEVEAEAPVALRDPEVKACTSALARDLEQRGLLPDDRTRTRRTWLFLSAFGALVGVAGARLYRAYLLEHSNVLFLWGLLLVSVVAAAACTFRRRTHAGNVALADLRALLRGSRRQPALSSHEVLLVAAAFGFAALPRETHGYTTALFPKARDGQRESSTCGGGCGGCGSGVSCGSSGCGSSGCGGGGGCGGGCGG